MYLKLLITFMYKRLYKFYISCWTSNYGWGKSLTALKHQLHRRATTPEGPSNINWSKKLTKNERFVWFSLLIFVVLLDLFWAKKLTKNEPFVWLRLLIFVVLLDLFWSKKLTKPSNKWESMGLNTDHSSSRTCVIQALTHSTINVISLKNEPFVWLSLTIFVVFLDLFGPKTLIDVSMRFISNLLNYKT